MLKLNTIENKYKQRKYFMLNCKAASICNDIVIMQVQNNIII